MKTRYRFIGVLLLALCVTACASFTENADQSKLVVQIATMKAIEAGANTADRAARVEALAAEGRTFLDAENVSVSVLEGAITDRLAALDLAPSDRVLANAVVSTVIGELNLRVGAGLLSAEQRYTVSQVLGWVEQAASFY